MSWRLFLSKGDSQTLVAQYQLNGFTADGVLYGADGIWTGTEAYAASYLTGTQIAVFDGASSVTHDAKDIDTVAYEYNGDMYAVVGGTVYYKNGDPTTSFTILVDATTIGVGVTGQLGKVFYYNVELTGDEVKDLHKFMRIPRRRPSVSLPIPARAPVSSDNLVGAWGYKDNCQFEDVSGNGNDGTNSGALVDKDGRFLFEGAERIVVTDNASLAITDNFTIFATIRNDSSASVVKSIVAVRNGGTFQYQFRLDAQNHLNFLPTTGGAVEGSILAVGKTYRVAVTVVSGVVTLYVDGSLDTQASGRSITNQAIDTVIGATAQPTNYWGGLIGQVSICDCVYTAEEIQEDYDAGVPEQMQDCSLWLVRGTRDKSVNNHAIAYSGVVVGKEMDFDGTDDVMDCGDIGSIQTLIFTIDPETDTEQVFQLDTGKTITFSGGDVTYDGVTAIATHIDAVAGIAINADRLQRIICVFAAVDCNNFEIGWDGADYGDIVLHEVRAHVSPWTDTDDITLDTLVDRIFW